MVRSGSGPPTVYLHDAFDHFPFSRRVCTPRDKIDHRARASGKSIIKSARCDRGEKGRVRQTTRIMFTDPIRWIKRVRGGNYESGFRLPRRRASAQKEARSQRIRISSKYPGSYETTQMQFSASAREMDLLRAPRPVHRSARCILSISALEGRKVAAERRDNARSMNAVFLREWKGKLQQRSPNLQTCSLFVASTSISSSVAVYRSPYVFVQLPTQQMLIDGLTFLSLLSNCLSHISPFRFKVESF